MFKSLEVKYPKFYQVFRFIIVIIASVLYAWNLRCFAKVRSLPVISGNRTALLSYQHPIYNIQCSTEHFPRLHCIPLHWQEVYHLLNRGNYTFQCAC